MSGLSTLIVLFSLITAGFIFWKLSTIKYRGKIIIPLHWRLLISLSVLLIIPAILLLGLAIAIIIAIAIFISIIFFIISWIAPER